ncbi:MAG: 50S ribosomal protein L11 methyltransferase [Desulfurococcales archaeon]|nr:50S ribosomal protein L11 methyltransferase [Desulfurococcales archaeon]
MGTAEVIVDGLSLEVELGECVYPPLEDTTLAVKMLLRIRETGEKPRRILDVATGSGILALASYILLKPDTLIATDISPYAVEVAKRNLRGTGALVVRCNMASCIAPRGWDLLIANPPYLPGEDLLEDCDGYEVMQWSSPKALEALCRDISRLAPWSVVLVYSSLTPIDLGRCVEGLGYRVLLSDFLPFFMEKIKAIYAVKGAGGGEAPSSTSRY